VEQTGFDTVVVGIILSGQAKEVPTPPVQSYFGPLLVVGVLIEVGEYDV
jgi:hypothetical protein